MAILAYPRRSPLRQPALGALAASGNPLAQGLVGAWLLNEGGGTKVSDVSGHGLTGTLSGGCSWTAGPLGTALACDGTSGYVSGGSLVISSTFSVSVRFRANSFAGFGSLVNCRTAANSFGWSIEPNNASKVQFVFAGGGFPVVASGTLVAGLPYHAVGAYDGATLRLYVNGVLAGSVAGTLLTGSGTLECGRNVVDHEFFSGALDGVALYNRALSASEAQRLSVEPFAFVQAPRRSLATSGATSKHFLALLGVGA